MSPTGGVKSTSPDTENHDKNGYAKLYDDNNIFMTNVDNSDTTYTNKAQEHRVQRAQHVGLSTPARRVVFVLFVDHVSHHIGSSRP